MSMVLLYFTAFTAHLADLEGFKTLELGHRYVAQIVAGVTKNKLFERKWSEWSEFKILRMHL
jgi:hypothetical protein